MITKLIKSKFFFAYLCVITIFLQISPYSISTSAATSPHVSYSVTGDAREGNSVKIFVNISNISGIYAGSLDFIYDSNILQIEDISIGNLFKNAEPTVENSSEGQASIAISLKGDSPPINGSGDLATISAKVLIGNKTIPLKTTNDYNLLGKNGFTTAVKLSDNNGNYIPYTFSDNFIHTLPKEDLNSPVVVNSITANRPSPAAPGSSITFTANATGG
ncbi:cohesin domain-containing protein, partial [Clostridium sp. LP20]|uniref:cohesin domain-containing protein n=1 Tax=Clostridium sp. LP20 TaxID=3418665 RepID=UPI003EE540E2